MDLLQEFEKEQVKSLDRPRLMPGDIVRVEMKVTEGEKTRLQTFEGTVLGVRGSGPSVTFTVRREVGEYGIERIFPLYNPLITNIEIVKRQKIRRAKLGYLRQAGRRRVKEDEKMMRRHMDEEKKKQQLAEEQQRKEQEAQAKEEVKKEEKEEPKAEATSEEKPEKKEGEDKKE